MVRNVFEHDNDGYTGVRRWRAGGGHIRPVVGGLTEGQCFGYSTRWIYKMLQGNPLNETKPEILISGVIQEHYERIGASNAAGVPGAVDHIISDMGLRVGQRLHVVWNLVPTRLSNWNGLFLVDIGIHWMALGRNNAEYYHFDANSTGLDVYDDADEFRRGVLDDWRTEYRAVGDNWFTNPNEECNIYEVRK